MPVCITIVLAGEIGRDSVYDTLPRLSSGRDLPRVALQGLANYLLLNLSKRIRRFAQPVPLPGL